MTNDMDVNTNANTGCAAKNAVSTLPLWRRFRMPRALWLVPALCVVTAMVAPVLLDGRAGILDTPVIAQVCRHVQWSKPLRVMDIMGFGNQARPLQVVAFLPAVLSGCHTFIISSKTA